MRDPTGFERKLNAYIERLVRGRYAWTGHSDDLVQAARTAVAAEIATHGKLPENLLQRYCKRRALCSVRDELRRLKRQNPDLAGQRPQPSRRQPLQPLGIRLSAESIGALAELAAERGSCITAVARELIEDALHDRT